MLKVGVIGYGGRIRGVLRHIRRYDAGVELAAITDVRNDEIRKECADDVKDVSFYEDAGEMLSNEKLDGVLVGTRCSLHATYAIQVARTGLPLFLEKPVATDMDDLVALADAFERSKSEVVVSFPLRLSPFAQQAKRMVDEGRIGEVHHVQAINNVSYGGVYYHGWYRDENETQGLWLQKATHDFDYIGYVLGQRPALVCAMMAKRVFKGDMPAGLRCIDCRRHECMEHPYAMYRHRRETNEVRDTGKLCAFAVDTGNEDMGSAVVEFENGAQACYSQNFFARRGAGARGARFIGYEGTIEFDWCKGELVFYAHHSPIIEKTTFDKGMGGHGGGDEQLADSFIKIMRGEGTSRSPIEAGITSVATCLAAKESCLTRRFVEVRDLVHARSV